MVFQPELLFALFFLFWFIRADTIFIIRVSNCGVWPLVCFFLSCVQMCTCWPPSPHPPRKPVTLKALFVLILVFRSVLSLLALLSTDEMPQYNANCWVTDNITRIGKWTVFRKHLHPENKSLVLKFSLKVHAKPVHKGMLVNSFSTLLVLFLTSLSLKCSNNTL